MFVIYTKGSVRTYADMRYLNIRYKMYILISVGFFLIMAKNETKIKMC